MKEQMKNLKMNQIVALLFAVVAGMNVLGYLRSVIRYGFYNPISMLIVVAGLALIAYTFYKDRKDLLMVGGFVLLAVFELYGFLEGFGHHRYSVDSWSYGMRFSFFCMLPELANMLGYVCAAGVVTALLTDYLPKYKVLAKKFWFMPAALIAGAFAVALVVLLFNAIGITRGYWMYRFLYFQFINIIGRFWVAAAFFLALTNIAYPEGLNKNAFDLQKESGEPVNYLIPAEDTAYRGLFKHTLLLLLTCGIWYFVWIYKTTAQLNCVEEEPKQTPVNQLLLCMFVPFYNIYWTYRNAQRIEVYARTKGMTMEISTLCLVLSLMGWFIPAIIMQDKMNQIVAGKPEILADESQNGLSEKGYIGLFKHTLLFMITCGIWYFIWVYRMTKELNVVNGEAQRSPVNQLLLCMFIPFYAMYWFYVSAQRIDKLAALKGVKSDLSTWCLLLSIVAPIIAAILMQDKMNKLVG